MLTLGFESFGTYAISEAPLTRFAVLGNSGAQLTWTVIIRAATHEYISRPDDDEPNQVFIGTLELENAFRIDRSIMGDLPGEQITVGLGQVSATNMERDYDQLATEHSVVGGAIEIRMGDRTRPYSEHRLILTGFLTQAEVSRETVTFDIRDGGYQLEVPALPNLYLGTGDEEGEDDLKNVRKPKFYGWNWHVQPVLVIPAYLAYQLNDGPIESVSAVYIRGSELTLAGNFSNIADLLDIEIETGEYVTCLALGWIRIAVASDEERGQVTVDFAGDKTGGTFVETAADIVRAILNSATEIVDPDDLIELSFDALNADQPAPQGYPIPSGDTQTVRYAISRIMASVGGWCGAGRDGRLGVYRFSEPALPTTGEYDRLNIQSQPKTVALPSAISPPPWRVSVGWKRNSTPAQTNLVESIDDTYRTFAAQEVRLAVAEDADARVDFPFGNDLVKADTFFRDEADALVEALRLLDLYATGRALYVFALCEPLFIHEPGQVIMLTYPDMLDLNDGKLMRIVRLSESASGGVEITAFG